ncbi:MAG: hypothetical protein QME40_06700 [bacterium]|nr:hypothetical protein [bacterium]
MPIIDLQAKTIQEDQQIYYSERSKKTFHDQSSQVESTNRTVREIVDEEGRKGSREKKEKQEKSEKTEEEKIEYVDPDRGQIIDIIR